MTGINGEKLDHLAKIVIPVLKESILLTSIHVRSSERFTIFAQWKLQHWKI